MIPRHHLPRLDVTRYRGEVVVHWVMTLEKRATGWLKDPFHSRFRELMLHAAARQDVWCPIYCLMPDHMHLVWMGMAAWSDQRLASRFLREHLNRALAPAVLQDQAYDHVLRAHERERGAFASVCFYIRANPVRAGLVEHPEMWPYAGAIVPGYPMLHPSRTDFWEMFWKLVAGFVRNRPPRS